MSEQPSPVPERSPAAESGLKRVARALGTGMGCLFLLAGVTIVAVGLLGIFVDDPTFVIAVVALFVAVVAYKASRRGRS